MLVVYPRPKAIGGHGYIKALMEDKERDNHALVLEVASAVC